MSRIGTLAGGTVAAALVWLFWHSAGGAQFFLLVLASLVGVWLAATIVVCAAAQHRRAAANTQLSPRLHGSRRGVIAASHLRR